MFNNSETWFAIVAVLVSYTAVRALYLYLRHKETEKRGKLELAASLKRLKDAEYPAHSYHNGDH